MVIAGFRTMNFAVNQQVTAMYIENSDFTIWMNKLSEKLDLIGKNLKVLTKTTEVMEDDKLLDNQDLAFLLKASYRTLQRHRTAGRLPYILVGHKVYYRASDVREFIQKKFDKKSIERLEKQLNSNENTFPNR